MDWKVLLLLAALVGGWFIRGWYDDAQQVRAVRGEVKEVTHANAKTVTRTLAAATHIQAVQAHVQTLDARIQTAKLTTPVTGGDHVAAPDAPAVPCLWDSPLSSPDFSLLYDSAADPASQAHDVPAPGH